MPNSPKSKHVVIPIDITIRLEKRKRPHQSLGGVIEELLNEVENKIREVNINEEGK